MKQNIQCAITRDLLSSYQENLISQGTKEWLEVHLKECKQCRKEYELLQEVKEEERLLEQKGDKRFKRSLIRYRYQTIGFVIGLIIAFVLLKGGWEFFWYQMSKMVHDSIEQQQEYGEFKRDEVGFEEPHLCLDYGECNYFIAEIEVDNIYAE